MARRSSLAARASWAALTSAALAVTLAAVMSSVFADALVVRASDQRLEAASSELARQLDAKKGRASIDRIVLEEQAEATSSGIRLVVYPAKGADVAGDRTVPRGDGCRTDGDLRVCSIRAYDGSEVAAAAMRERHFGILALASVFAAVFAACVAWALARILGRRAVGPLVRLQARIADLPLDETTRALPPVDLGSDENVSEVDDLRGAIRTLLTRMQQSMDRSSRFAANAAHELRTPLTTLRAELELLAESPSETAATEAGVATALRKVEQLQTLTERLLLLATPEENVEAFELMSLRDVIDDVVADLGENDRARVTADGDADVFVRGDAAALRILVSNGLSNALKFAQHVDVELETDGDDAILAIDDDGPGVSEAERKTVFEPFVRVASNRAPGHGLGLALVAHVARWHAGEARLLASRLRPQGARLEIRLPRNLAT